MPKGCDKKSSHGRHRRHRRHHGSSSSSGSDSESSACSYSEGSSAALSSGGGSSGCSRGGSSSGSSSGSAACLDAQFITNLAQQNLDPSLIRQLAEGEYSVTDNFLEDCTKPRKIPPTEVQPPSAYFTQPKEARYAKEHARAPLFSAMDQGITFDYMGNSVTIKASAMDTEGLTECTLWTIPTGLTQRTLVNYTSNIWVGVISGTFKITTYGVERTATVGSDVYIKAGTPYMIENASNSVSASAFINFVRAPTSCDDVTGSLGFFQEVSCLQRAVNGRWNVRDSIFEEIGSRYWIYPVKSVCPGQTPVPVVPAGQVIFLPMLLDDRCGGNNTTWGLLENQNLLINSILTAPPAPLSTGQPAKTSTIIRSSDMSSDLLVDSSTVSLNISAALRTVACGSPGTICNVRINGYEKLILPTGQAYFTFFDNANSTVVITPVDDTFRAQFAAMQAQNTVNPILPPTVPQLPYNNFC